MATTYHNLETKLSSASYQRRLTSFHQGRLYILDSQMSKFPPKPRLSCLVAYSNLSTPQQHINIYTCAPKIQNLSNQPQTFNNISLLNRVYFKPHFRGWSHSSLINTLYWDLQLPHWRPTEGQGGVRKHAGILTGDCIVLQQSNWFSYYQTGPPRCRG